MTLNHNECYVIIHYVFVLYGREPSTITIAVLFMVDHIVSWCLPSSPKQIPLPCCQQSIMLALNFPNLPCFLQPHCTIYTFFLSNWLLLFPKCLLDTLICDMVPTKVDHEE